MSHHVLDVVTPSADSLPIEDHMGNRNPPNLSLTESLEDNRPNQVVTLVNRLTAFGPPKKNQDDQSNDEECGVAHFFPPRLVILESAIALL
jgi:hypothetical protein